MCSRQVTRLLLRSTSVTKDSAIAASCDEPLAAGRVGRTPRGGSTQSGIPRGLGLAWLQEEVRLVEIAQGTRVRYTEIGVFSAVAGNQ